MPSPEVQDPMSQVLHGSPGQSGIVLSPQSLVPRAFEQMIPLGCNFSTLWLVSSWDHKTATFTARRSSQQDLGEFIMLSHLDIGYCLGESGVCGFIDMCTIPCAQASQLHWVTERTLLREQMREGLSIHSASITEYLLYTRC